MEFITAEVEVQGNPKVKPGALVNIKKVGEYSGHYLVTEANHFYDSAGYNCIFYVARDKWGNSSQTQQQQQAARQQQQAARQQQQAQPSKVTRSKAGKQQNEAIDFTLQDDQGKALSGLKVRVRLASGETLEVETDGDGHVHIDDKPPGQYMVEVPEGIPLATLHLRVEDGAGHPVTNAIGTVALSDGAEIGVMTDDAGEIHLTDVPPGEYTFKLESEGRGREEPGEAEGTDEDGEEPAEAKGPE